MIRSHVRRGLAVGALAALALALSGCLLSPGKFASQLDLRNDRTFTYTYRGEIYLLALSKLAAMGEASSQTDDEFVAMPCYDDETFEERECTSDELVQQEQDWQAAAEGRAKSRAEEAEMMRAMLGGIDPADPEAAAELAARLERQKGWNKVVHKGDGLFEVDFALSGRLDHDFVFPTMERFPMANLFLEVGVRKDGSVRVDAPGFVAQAGGNPYLSMMSGMAGAYSTTGNARGDLPQFPEIDGTFTLVTNGEILANNTDEGPRATTAGKTLQWRINKRTQTAPMTLVKFGG